MACRYKGTTMKQDAVLTKNQAAAQLSVSITTLDKMFKRGELPRIQITVRRVGVPQSAITDYLTRHTTTVGGV